MAKPAVKSFQATLERGSSSLNWVIVRIPFDSAKLWGTRSHIRVKGDVNGFPFRISLFPTGSGGHAMVINKKLQRGAKISVGMKARFRMERDTDERVVTIPAELQRIFREYRALRRWFDQLSHSIRYEIGKWIMDVKSAETRIRRANQIAERLLATMEAEREPPPILKAVFARDDLVRQGWERMPPSRRRMHLFGIFHYNDPEARSRRVAKVVEDAYQVAEKSSRKKRNLDGNER